MKKPLVWLKMQWKEVSIDRKIELLFIVVGVVVASIVMKNGIAQLEQMNIQTAAMQSQLAEMRSGSADTKMLADAAAASTAAWIVVERFVIKSIENDQILFNITFKNVGKTPALDARAGWEFTFTTPSLPNKLADVPKYDPWQCQQRPDVHLGTVKPDGVWSNEATTGTGRMSIEQIRMIKNNTARLFIHGCAQYRDILTDRERITEFGAYYPGTFDTADLAVAIYAPYSRMK